MNEITIRKMTAADIPQVAAIEKELFTLPWSEQAFADELENKSATILVAQAGGEIVGFADMREIAGECYINNIGVKASHRRKSIGRAFMQALEDNATEGAEFITLEVRQSNEAAIMLYKSMGYIKVGTSRGFYEQPTEDADLMTKYLERVVIE